MSSPFKKKHAEEKQDATRDFRKQTEEETDETDEERIKGSFREEEEERERVTTETLENEENEEDFVKPKKRIKVRRKRRPEETDEEKERIIIEQEQTSLNIPTGRKIKEAHKIKIQRKEKEPFDMNRGLLYLLVFGILIVIFFSQELTKINPVMSWVMIIFGMMAFLPAGILMGKFLLDPFMRCKIYRRVGNRNFGMVHLVQKGGKKIEIRIKNLTDDVIIQGTKLWVLEDGGIYYCDRNDNMMLHARFDSKSLVTSPNNIPMLFLDADTMLPLRFYKYETKSNPQQVGATVLGYINNQIAKNLFFKRSMTFFYIIILVLQCINVVGIIVLYQALVK
jgi:hypothetical protein